MPPKRDARRTLKQHGLMAVGLHPLSLTLRRALRIMPNRTREKCGGCRWLEPLDWDVPLRQAKYKCWFDGGARVTRGRATTVRKWWPACVDFEGRTDGQEAA